VAWKLAVVIPKCDRAAIKSDPKSRARTLSGGGLKLCLAWIPSKKEKPRLIFRQSLLNGNLKPAPGENRSTKKCRLQDGVKGGWARTRGIQGMEEQKNGSDTHRPFDGRSNPPRRDRSLDATVLGARAYGSRCTAEIRRPPMRNSVEDLSDMSGLKTLARKWPPHVVAAQVLP